MSVEWTTVVGKKNKKKSVMQIADITDTTATTTDSTKQRCCHRCHRPARNRIAEMWSSQKPDRSPSRSKITITTADGITTTTTTTTTTMMTMKDCHRSAWSEWLKNAWKHCCQSTRKSTATRCNPADPPNRKRSTVDPFSTPYAASLLPYILWDRERKTGFNQKLFYFQ